MVKYVYYEIHEWLAFHYVGFFKQKSAYEMSIIVWISDVCSSDLQRAELISQRIDHSLRRMWRLLDPSRQCGQGVHEEVGLEILLEQVEFQPLGGVPSHIPLPHGPEVKAHVVRDEQHQYQRKPALEPAVEDSH